MPVVQLPGAAAFDELLDMLYGKDSTVTQSPTSVSADSTSIRLSFVDEAGLERVVCVSDLQAAASLGAALTMIPSGQAKADADSGSVRETIIENFAEVANVMSSMFQHPGAPTLVLDERPLTVVPSVEIPADREIVTFDIQVPGYEGGLVAFWMA